MTTLIEGLRRLHEGIFDGIDRLTGGWFMGLFARFVFAATLYVYYLNAARLKLEDGLAGFFTVKINAYAQILGTERLDAIGYDVSLLPLTDHLTVYAGTYGEFALPVMIIVGLFARIGAVGMIAFIAVQTAVDIIVHGVASGTLFDNRPGDLIDQRLYWTVPLVYLILRGPGALSIDALLRRAWLRATLAPRFY